MKTLVIVITLSLFIPTSAHADLAEQGSLGSLMTGAIASAPAVRLTPPEPPPKSVEQMILDVWPDDLEQRAIRIARRESNFECCVRTWCCFGVFQIYLDVHRKWLNEMGIYTMEDLYDPLTNVVAAYHLYELAGWSPWDT